MISPAQGASGFARPPHPGASWRRVLGRAALAAVLAVAGLGRARAQQCPTCIQNTAAPQNAIINIGTATIRGAFTASTATIIYAYLTNVTIANLSGNGAALTNLNASALATGTVSTTVVSGQYFGITGTGILSTGTWQGNVVGTQWGGTGRNFVSASSGSIVYFDSPGHMSNLLPPTVPQALLQTGFPGGSAPVWTSSPAVSGANLYNIPAGRLVGTLPTSVTVSSNSIPYVAGASVLGDISGRASNIYGTLLQSQIATGTWSSAYAASSVTATGVAAQVCGGPAVICALNLHTDGRVYGATQYNLVVYSTSIAPGPLPVGVTIAAAQITSGTLINTVVASSVAASGVLPGIYGSGTFIPQITVGGDGRVTKVLQFGIGAASTSTAYNNIDNAWSHAQTSFSSWTFVNAPIKLTGSSGYVTSASSVNASAFFGDASHLTGIPSTGSIVGVYLPLAGGTLTGQVTTTSSMTALGAILANSSVTASAFFGDASHLTGVLPSADIPNTVTSSFTVTGAGGLGVTYGVTAGSVTVGTNVLTANVVSGNVGIGTTSPGAKLDIIGNEYIETNGGLFSDYLMPYTGSVPWTLTTNQSANVPIVFMTENSTRVYIAGGGNVGIGTVNPLSIADIRGTAADPSNSSNNAVLWVGDGSGYTDYGIGFGTSHTAPYNPWIQATSTFGHGNFSLNINPLGGNVGIGTTSPGSAAGFSPVVASSGTNAAFQFTGTGGASWSWGATSSEAELLNETTFVKPFQISNAGYVGILTASLPAFPFDVTGSQRIQNNGEMLHLQYASNGGTNYIGWDNGSGTELWRIGGGMQLQQDELSFDEGTTSRLYLQTGGNVGIGTIFPGTTIDVNGAATVRGQETVTSSQTVQGNAFSVGGSTFSVTGGGIYPGISISTQAAGSAGSLVTVSCASKSYAMSGGCACTGGVATTAETNMPYPSLTVAGSMPTGWQCQQSGTTGGACSAYVLCSFMRF